jgi:hypothetical protein
MKHEIFFSILSMLLSPQSGETGNYHKFTWKDQWVNVSRNTPIAYYQTPDRLYVSTNGMENNVEKLILRIDRLGSSNSDYNRFMTDFYVDVNCLKKEALITHVTTRDPSNQITSTYKIEKTQTEKFDDSHLYGVVCAARALNDVLVNNEVKPFDTCDFRQQVKGNNPIQYTGFSYNFPIRWNKDTCRAVKNSVWLFGAGQEEAARLRLAWVPHLAIYINNINCKVNCVAGYNQSRFFIVD